ncbi:phosphopantetheine-binding protein, partial [Micromonospora tulbaghiae]|uniref:phosphopantetheine-binding protein n=1 Tax=Micromonospora tulbaghiae TaxID=479978 RepID=UPI0029C10CB9
GGNSLHAIQLITHIHNHFHITLPLRTLYTHPTLTTMATTIDTATQAEQDRLAEEIDQMSEEELDRLLAESADDSSTSVTGEDR